MSANILTPLMLWRNFSLDKKPRFEVVSSKQKSDMSIEKFYIDARSTKQGVVKVYGISARPVSDNKQLPAVIVFKGKYGLDEEKIAVNLAKEGYYAFVVNLYGKYDGAESFTIYPDDISYANFEQSKDTLLKVKKDVKHTCWYEWASASKYVFNTIKGLDSVGKVGVIGIKEFSNAVWQLTATEKDVDCMVSILGFGWESNNGIYKFGDMLEPKFSDETLMFVAGIESQSYAMHVKCPTLLLTSTNSATADVDRAHDTISKIKEDVFRAVDLSPNYTDAISADELNNIKLFLDSYLRDEFLVNACPIKSEIVAECKFGKIFFELTLDGKCCESAELYVAEEVVNPARRCWKRIMPSKKESDKLLFEYLPYAESSQVLYFAKVKTESGFTYSTVISSKKFSPSEIIVSHNSRVIYSGRDENSESVFAPYDQADKIILKPDCAVVEKSGPMGIKGVYSSLGIQTFRINAKKYRPQDDAIMMFDVYSKDENEITIKLIQDGDGYATEYFSTVHINGGKVWYNIKLAKAKFKTAEGMILRSYDKVTRMVFTYEKPALINNALWV